jgi:hypothetical protein
MRAPATGATNGISSAPLPFKIKILIFIFNYINAAK